MIPNHYSFTDYTGEDLKNLNQELINPRFCSKEGYFKMFWKYTVLFYIGYVGLCEWLWIYLEHNERDWIYFLVPILVSGSTIVSTAIEKWPHELLLSDDRKTVRLVYYFWFQKRTVEITFEQLQYVFQKERIMKRKTGYVLTIFKGDGRIIKIKPNEYWREEVIKRIVFELFSRNILVKK